MRKFKVYYYREINDECQDLEEIVEARSFVEVYGVFHDLGIVYKRVYKIEELSF